MKWMVATVQLLALIGFPRYPRNIEIHAKRMAGLYLKPREEYIRMLEARVELWSEWGKKNSVPLFKTEAWVPINYSKT